MRNFFYKRKVKKLEKMADEQYLDALSIIQESAEIYLDLLANAQERGEVERSNRLRTKLNSAFEYHSKNWNGELDIIHTIVSKCHITPNEKMLKLN